MYSLLKPTPPAIEAYRISQIVRPAFQTTAAIPDPPPRGYRPNRGLSPVGRGEADYRAAVEAVQQWEMFPHWVQIDTVGEPVRLGQIAAVTARCCGVWAVNCSRVVDVTLQARQFAFTYATTDEHAMSGAERFWLEWGEDDAVWFGVHSISRPRDWCVWLALPALRHIQQRFAADAPVAVRRAIERRLSPGTLATTAVPFHHGASH